MLIALPLYVTIAQLMGFEASSAYHQFARSWTFGSELYHFFRSYKVNTTSPKEKKGKLWHC